ncbi:hypothetical protein [Tautonia marina]|uniref:hypothetical protein n=1 Tax=Tautonia marina TaxID=2653855 RepID=UPI0012606C62|nr:hypothetical protein [Tautonia marina]
MHNIRSLIGLLMVMALAGCGGGDGVGVSGMVTFQGQPVEDGMIQFLSNEASGEGRSAGAPIVDGKYAIARNGGPPPGSYRVEVTAYQEVREQTAEELGGVMFGRDPSELGIAPEALMVRENVIPEQYNTSSTLTVTIPSQRNFQYDVEIP